MESDVVLPRDVLVDLAETNPQNLAALIEGHANAALAVGAFWAQNLARFGSKGEKGMKITFHGAAQTVTGSQHLIEVNGSRLLLECGMFQGHRADSERDQPQLPFQPA